MSEEDLYLGRAPLSMAAEGIIALFIGALILAWPGMTLVTLTWIVGLFALLAGICALIALIGARKAQRGVLAVTGLSGIILGCIFLAWPMGTTAALLWFLMIWLVLYGIFRIVHAVRQPPEDRSKWIDICIGLISIVVGVLLIALPVLEGLEALALLLGIYAVITGILHISLAWTEWNKRKHMHNE